MSRYKKHAAFMDWLPLIAVILIIGIPVTGLIYRCFGGAGIEYSDGQRTGLVYKISRKGVLWKTWEGELSLQMLERDESGALVPKVFNFSVSDPDVAAQIETAAKAGRAVTLSYKQYILRGFSHGSTGYDVVAVSEN